ncbi:MAG TPA: site-2 protease family protein [Conexibacter sp.]|nr:site-2 protease family protein [Conexibacter sp.]
MAHPTITTPVSQRGAAAQLRPSPPPGDGRMRGTLRLARISGIEIEAHWSWTLIVALLVWSLASAVFPTSNPGLSDGTYVAMGVAAALLLFVSLAAHELGHALQARRERMTIDGITLWLLGGVARFSGAFPSAGAELRIAIAGPVVSLAIGVVLLAASLVIPLPAALDGVVYWLGSMNLLLLAFNMIPALPLDGGRALRAALWARSGDHAAATRRAVAIANAFARALIGGGVVLVLLTGALGGLWFALIGWFLLNAAAGEGMLAAGATAGPHVAEVTVREPVCVPATTTVEQFLEQVVTAHRHLVYPVLNGTDPVGLVSFRDALRTRPDERAVRSVAQIMTPLDRVLVLDGTRPLTEAVGELMRAPLRRALVVDGADWVGLLSPTDALRAIELLNRR